MAVTRKPKPVAAEPAADDKVEQFIRGGGAPAIVPPAEQPEPEGNGGDAEGERAKRLDTRTTPRFSLRLDRDLLDEIEEILEDAKVTIGMPRHVRLTKSDFVEWAIREAIDRVRSEKNGKPAA